jgi:hypothetical protein
MSDFPEMEYKSTPEAERFELEPDATSLNLLQKVYRSSSVPLNTRLRAAGMALQFEHPKLGVTVNIWNGDFADRLDRAIARSSQVMIDPPKIIEQSPSPDRGFRRV